MIVNHGAHLLTKNTKGRCHNDRQDFDTPSSDAGMAGDPWLDLDERAEALRQELRDLFALVGKLPRRKGDDFPTLGNGAELRRSKEFSELSARGAQLLRDAQNYSLIDRHQTGIPPSVVEVAAALLDPTYGARTREGGKLERMRRYAELEVDGNPHWTSKPFPLSNLAFAKKHGLNRSTVIGDRNDQVFLAMCEEIRQRAAVRAKRRALADQLGAKERRLDETRQPPAEQDGVEWQDQAPDWWGQRGEEVKIPEGLRGETLAERLSRAFEDPPPD